MDEGITWSRDRGCAIGYPANDPRWTAVAIERVDDCHIRWFATQEPVQQPLAWHHGAIEFVWPSKLALYRLELFGLMQPLDQWPVPWSAWVLPQTGSEPTAGDLALKVFLARALMPGTVVHAEIRYLPDFEAQYTSIRNADWPGTNQQELRAAQRGFALINAFANPFENRGRKRLEDDPNSEWRGIVERAESLKRDQPLLPWDVIAQQRVFVPPDTLKKWRRRYHQESDRRQPQ